MTVESERLYLYAVVDNMPAGDTLPAGIGGAPVRLLRHRTLVAVIGPIDVLQLKDTPTAAQTHEHVIEWFMGNGGTLPVRFGTVFSNEAALREALEEQYSTLCADLDRLAGRVEVGLRIVWDIAAVRDRAEQAAPPVAGDRDDSSKPGLRYMQQRLREAAVERSVRAEAESLAQQCRTRLAAHAEAIQTRILVTDGIPVSASLLMRRGDVDAVVGEVAQFQRDIEPLSVICTGPWPPYHFVSNNKGDGS